VAYLTLYITKRSGAVRDVTGSIRGMPVGMWEEFASPERAAVEALKEAARELVGAERFNKAFKKAQEGY
jgi:hypothetical protein